jgi:adenylylsulfate kinase-like enzyme
VIIWINGAAGSGKSTLARELTLTLWNRGINNVWLDGDAVRTWLTPDCTYSDLDRRKHLQRVWSVAQLIKTGGTVVVCSFVGLPPVAADYHIHLEGRERCPPWEGTTWPRPLRPDLVLNTGEKEIYECNREILDLLPFSSDGGLHPMRGTLR